MPSYTRSYVSQATPDSSFSALKPQVVASEKMGAGGLWKVCIYIIHMSHSLNS